MFENVTSTKNPDDIFAEVDKAPVSDMPTNTAPNISSTPAPVGLRPSSMSRSDNLGGKSGAGKALKKLLLLILIMAVLGAVAYMAYGFLVSKKAPANINEPESRVNVNVPIIEDVIEVATSTDEASSSVVVEDLPLIISDYDADGLADDEERILGTDPLNADTDKDSLSDYEEIKVYNTNPLLSDTDGDSYADGQEVSGGYNPDGKGKLQ
jgi:hypothetical protein